MTKRKQEKEEVENAAPDNSHFDIMSEISQESTLPKKKRPKTRNNVSVTIEVMTKLDKDNIQKLQRQRETLLAQGIAKNYPFQNSISPKLYDTIGQFLLLQEATDIEYDMEREHDVQRFAQFLEKNEKTVLDLLVQQYIHDVRNDDVAQKLKNMMPSINPSHNCLAWYLAFTTMASDNKLDEEQRLGVIAAHKSKFATFVKGPTAVKEIMKAN